MTLNLETVIGEGKDLNLHHNRTLVYPVFPGPTLSHLLFLAGNGIVGGGLGHFFFLGGGWFTQFPGSLPGIQGGIYVIKLLFIFLLLIF